MASLGESFDASAQPAMDNFSPIPVGDYAMVVTDSEIKATKDGLGKYIKLKIEIIDGQYQGRLLFVNLNLWNQNPTAVEIAKKEFGALCKAVNVLFATDTAQVHNIPFVGKVSIEPGKDVYGPQNRIKGYISYATANAPVLPFDAKTAPVNVATKPAPAAPNGKPPINPATGKPYKVWENWPGKQAK